MTCAPIAYCVHMHFNVVFFENDCFGCVALSFCCVMCLALPFSASLVWFVMYIMHLKSNLVSNCVYLIQTCMSNINQCDIHRLIEDVQLCVERNLCLPPMTSRCTDIVTSMCRPAFAVTHTVTTTLPSVQWGITRVVCYNCVKEHKVFVSTCTLILV